MNRTYIPRKESIVLTAVDIISELGIHELSTREIARRQGVSEASLYRHFKSKQAILLEVLDYYSSYDTFIINTIENKNQSGSEGIIHFFKSYAEYYENYPAITAVGLAYSVLLYDKVVSDKFLEIYNKRADFIIRLINKGLADGSISAGSTDEILCHVLQGTFNDITLKWRLDNYSFSFKERVLSALEEILRTS